MTPGRVPLASLPEGSIVLAGTFQPAIGATAYVYKHGTSTPVTVYTAEAGTGTLTQPLTSDSNGQLPGWIVAEQDIDVVASYGGGTPASPAEGVALRAEDLVGIDSGTQALAIGAGAIPLVSVSTDTSDAAAAALVFSLAFGG